MQRTGPREKGLLCEAAGGGVRGASGASRGIDGSVYADWFPFERGRDPHWVKKKGTDAGDADEKRRRSRSSHNVGSSLWFGAKD